MFVNCFVFSLSDRTLVIKRSQNFRNRKICPRKICPLQDLPFAGSYNIIVIILIFTASHSIIVFILDFCYVLHFCKHIHTRLKGTNKSHELNFRRMNVSQALMSELLQLLRVRVESLKTGWASVVCSSCDLAYWGISIQIKPILYSPLRSNSL